MVTSDVDCLSITDIYQIKPSDLKFYWTFFHRGQKIVLEGPKAFKRIQNGPKWSIAGTSAVSAPLGNRYKESFLFSTYFNIFQHIPSIGLNWKMQYTALVVGSAIIVGRSVTAFVLALLQRLEWSQGKIDARDWPARSRPMSVEPRVAPVACRCVWCAGRLAHCTCIILDI